MAIVTIKSKDSDNQALVNTDGRLLVDTGGASGGNASVAANGGAIPGSSTQISGEDPDGNVRPVSVDANGFVNVQGVSSETGLNAFQTAQYTVGTSAVHLAPVALTNRSSISLDVTADTNVRVYIGNSSAVTVLTGYPLSDGASLQIDLTPDGNIWAISTAPGQTVAVLEIG